MTQNFIEELEVLIKSGTHVINLVSYEWERAHAALLGISEEIESVGYKKKKIPVFVWSSSFGLRKMERDGTLTSENSVSYEDPINLLDHLFSLDFKEGIVILEDFHPYLDESNFEVIRWVREFTRLPVESKKYLILFSPAPRVPIELQKDVPIIEIPLPDRKVIKQTLKFVADQYKLEEEVGQVEYYPEVLDSALGLTTIQAARAFSKAAVENGQITEAEIPIIIREKEQIIKEGNLLEYFHPDFDFDMVGGMDNLKEWLENRGKGFKDEAKEFGLTTPRGVLLLGVQGCGKSLTAKAIANEWKLPLLRFDIGRVFGSLVGQSETNIRNALQVAEALAPCVLWIDEIEKGLSGVGSSDATDGGTASRVFGTILTWMQEKEKPVFVIATANDISKLPPELLRKGRFDEIFFVDIPNKEERKEIFKIHLKKKKRDPSKFNIEKAAGETVGYSGAEIEEIINEALYIAFNKEKELSDEDIFEAIKRIVPLTLTMKEEITDLRKWADVRARKASSGKPESLSSFKSPDIPQLKQERRNPFIKDK